MNSSVSADEVIAHVADGTFDIAASWTVISARRMEYVSFSYPFYDSGLSFVYRVDVADTVRRFGCVEISPVLQFVPCGLLNLRQL